MAAWVAPAVAAGAQSGLSLSGNIMANTANRMNATRQFDRNQSMWERSNAWNLAQWHRENQYNSPQAQMARFAAAGLNPHLIYGKGSAGNASALKSPDVKGYTRPEARNITQGMDTMGDYARFKNLEAQTDNVREQRNVAANQAALLGTKNQREIFAFGKENSIREYDVSYAKGAMEKMQADARKAGTEADFASDTKAKRIEALKESVENLKKTGKNLDAQHLIHEFEIFLNNNGLTKSDPMVLRIASKAFGKVKGFWKWLTEDDQGNLRNDDTYKNFNFPEP